MTAESKRTTSKAGKLITFKTTATRPLFVYGKSLTPYLTFSLYKELLDHVTSECFRVCDVFILLLLLSHNPCLSVLQMGNCGARQLSGFPKAMQEASGSAARAQAVQGTTRAPSPGPPLSQCCPIKGFWTLLQRTDFFK